MGLVNAKGASTYIWKIKRTRVIKINYYNLKGLMN